MKKLIYILLLVGMAGCAPAIRLSVADLEAPTLNGLSSLHGRVVVENGGARDLVVENVRIVLKYRGRELGSARLMLPVEVPAESSMPVRYDLALEDFSLASLQTLLVRVPITPEEVTVDVKGWVRMGGMRKKIKIKGVTLLQIKEIMTTFAR